MSLSKTMFRSNKVSSSPPATCRSRAVPRGTRPDTRESGGRVEEPGVYAGPGLGPDPDGARATCLRGLLWIEQTDAGAAMPAGCEVEYEGKEFQAELTRQSRILIGVSLRWSALMCDLRNTEAYMMISNCFRRPFVSRATSSPRSTRIVTFKI
jgi:hypothetical protein